MNLLLDTHVLIWALNEDQRLSEKARELILDPDNALPHHDSFDRMLIAQAKAENMSFLTHDSLLPHYNEKCIISV